jgi:excisionase family DNA binding protein
MKNTQEEIVFTIKEVADKLKVTPQQVYKIVKDKEINAFYVGKAIRISKSELERYISFGANQ